MSGRVIAIDGPSGSGKSTLARSLACQLGLAYLDTGAMYRAAALWVADHQALDSPEQMGHLVKQMDLVLGLDPTSPAVWLAGQDVGQRIREPSTSAMVSQVSTVLAVRQVLIQRQRQIINQEKSKAGWAKGRGIVVEGRDITTVVVPEADTRLLLTASPAVRLARRSAELTLVKKSQSAKQLHQQVLKRDKKDSTVASFQSPAEGVLVVDSTNLTAEQTLSQVLRLVEA